MQQKIRYFQFCPKSTVNGPGSRAVVWVQGCRFHCDGCFNKESWSLHGGRDVSVDELLRAILSIDDIEGVTFSGGEPMLQAESLSELAEKLKQGGLTVMSYTGYTREELNASEDLFIQKLISNCDLLITGRYEKNNPSANSWAGSANQEIIFLSEKYIHLKRQVEKKRNDFEIIVNRKGDFFVTGIIPDWYVRAFEQI